jgi:hypothetical protein
MADGAQTKELARDAERRAQAAAADAAVEARGEARIDSPPPARHPNASRKLKNGKAWHEFKVDVWITNLNSVEFGVYKHTRNKAKSRQFTSDMDIFAEIIENGERTGLLGYREDLWKNGSGMDKRLVFKLFNESLNWRATMDLMVGRSLQLTFGARGLPVVVFSANINDHDFMVYIERSAHKWPFLPENFSFFIIEEGKARFYRLRRAFIDLGGDYKLFDEGNRLIGTIDGAFFSFGKWRGKIKAEHADQRLVMVLQMFCGMLAFNRNCRKHIRRLANDVASGRVEAKIEKQEADLYMNPRRVR